MASKIHGKSFQVGLSWPKLAESWPNLGTSCHKLASKMKAFIYKLTKCGCHALPERKVAQRSANMARKPSQNGGRGGSELKGEVQTQVFRS